MKKPTVARRAFLASVIGAAGAWAHPSRGDASRARCGLCGMKIDPSSGWRAELTDATGRTVAAFDTPRCALAAWRRGKVAASGIRVQEFYDRRWVDGHVVRFAIGSDVNGPMGPDLVPVAAERAEKFVKDHAAERALPLDEVTSAVIDAVK